MPTMTVPVKLPMRSPSSSSIVKGGDDKDKYGDELPDCDGLVVTYEEEDQEKELEVSSCWLVRCW